MQWECWARWLRLKNLCASLNHIANYQNGGKTIKERQSLALLWQTDVFNDGDGCVGRQRGIISMSLRLIPSIDGKASFSSPGMEGFGALAVNF